jgi:hypothetical protein
VRGDHAFVNFIKQELTQRLQVIKCFIDDGQRTGEHGRTPKCGRLYLYTADCAEGQICGSTQTPRQVHQGGECVWTLPISAQTRSRLGWPQLIEGATRSRRRCVSVAVVCSSTTCEMVAEPRLWAHTLRELGLDFQLPRASHGSKSSKACGRMRSPSVSGFKRRLDTEAVEGAPSIIVCDTPERSKN